jgi:hypothetical protein
MSNSSWDRAVAELLAAQRDFMNGDAIDLQALYSHREDVEGDRWRLAQRHADELVQKREPS